VRQDDAEGPLSVRSRLRTRISVISLSLRFPDVSVLIERLRRRALLVSGGSSPKKIPASFVPNLRATLSILVELGVSARCFFFFIL